MSTEAGDDRAAEPGEADGTSASRPAGMSRWFRWTPAAGRTAGAGRTARAGEPPGAGAAAGATAADGAGEPTGAAGAATGGAAAAAGGAKASEDLPPPNEMLPKEQQIGYLLAALVVAWVGAAGGSRVVQGKTAYIGLTVLGLAAAGAIAYATRRGRRMFSAIVAVVAGLAVSGFFPLNFACLIFGGYLMLRQSQAQKKYNLAHPRQAGKPGDRSFRSGRTAGRRGRTAEPPAGPQASRRYTPPKSKTNRRGR